MRHEPRDLLYRLVVDEPLVVMLPSDHRLASHKTIDLRAMAGESFIGVSDTAPALRALVASYIDQSGLAIVPQHEADNLAMAISLVASTRGFALLPIYATNFLPWSVVSRPLKGKAPTIALVLGHHKTHASPVLSLLLSRMDELIARVARKRRPG
jgi:LysR family hca operon transcriptional activator